MLKLKNKKIGITGGSGYIGSHLAIALQDNNLVRIIDLVKPNERILNKVEFKKCDIANYKETEETIKGLEIVFHKAGSVGGVNSMANPFKYYQVNTIGTLNVLKACFKHKVKRLIFSSTELVYGKEVMSPISEEQLPKPTTIYGATKLIAEKYIQIFDQKYDLPTLIFRFCRIRDSKKEDVVTKFTRQVLNNEKIVFFDNGKQIFDFVDINDVIRADILGATSKIRNEAINISSGQGVSVNEILRMIMEFAKKERVDLEYKKVDLKEFIPEHYFCPQKMILDVRKAKRLLNFSPKTAMADSIKATVLCFLKQTKNG